MIDRNIEKWPITGRLQFIPVRSFGWIDEKLIGLYAMRQNRYISHLESFTLRGFKNLDIQLTKKDGDKVTLRQLLLFSKDTHGRYFFEMVERANSDKIFLVYDKKLNHQATRSDVRKFAAHFKQELKNILTPDSLQNILADTSSMSYYNNNPIIKAHLSDITNQYSTILCSNPQEEEPMEEDSTSPLKPHRNYYITELPT